MSGTSREWLLWIVFGALIGWIASAITGTGSNLILDVLIGIAGAYIGGWIMRRSAPSRLGDVPGSLDWRSFLVALLGAIILCALVRLLG